MSQFPPFTLTYPRTLAALLRLAEAGLLGNPQQSREIASAIRRIAVWLDTPLDQVPTTPAVLRRHLARINPQAIEVSPRRVANVRCLLGRALELTGVKNTNRPVAEALTEPWRELIERLHDERYLRSSLAPFARFCSSLGVGPDAVSEATSQRYRDFLERSALSKRPATTHQTVCRTWEQARNKVSGWPDVVLTVPRRAITYTFRLTDFPQSFRDDLEAYLRRLSCAEVDDLLSDNAPSRPLKASSIATRRYQIRQHASALVHSGLPAASITSLATLTTPSNFKAGLKFLLDRKRQDPANTRSAGMVAHTIRTIAKYHTRPAAAELDILNNLTRRLTPKSIGMTDKIRRRLGQFQDQVMLERFLVLAPGRLAGFMRKGVHSRRQALDFSLLLGLEILTFAPMRVSNLAGIDCNQDLRLPKQPDGDAILLIPAARSKTRVHQQYHLPPEVVGYLRFYFTEVRPYLDPYPPQLGSESRPLYLFPGSSGRPKRADTLSKQLSRLVREKTGLEFSPHLMRHFSATQHINEHPGDYETPRRLLGHSSHDTTYRTYQGLETDSASRLHAALIRTRRRCMPEFRLPPRRPQASAEAEPGVRPRRRGRPSGTSRSMRERATYGRKT